MPTAKLRTHLVASTKEFEQLIALLAKQKAFAFDLETTSLNTLEAKIVGISVAYDTKEGYYIPIAHRDGSNMDLAIVLKKLQPLLSNPKILKIGHNLKYDCSVLRNYDVAVHNLWDTLLAGYLLRKGIFESALDLKSLATQYLGLPMKPITDLIGPAGKKQKVFSDVPVGQAAVYGSLDSIAAFGLKQKMEKEIASEKLNYVLEHIELPLIPVLMDMERHGMKIDSAKLAVLSKTLAKRLETLSRDIFKLAGSEFNLNSPKQLADVLYVKLKIPTHKIKKTKTGFSTAVSELEKIDHPVAEKLMEFRELDKLKNTYVDTLPTMVSAKTGRVHTTFNQAIAATGRLSSTNPALQNIPVRTDMGKEVRGAFIVEKGNVLISADYSQIELRILAHLSKDDELFDAFKHGIDIHAKTASIVEKVPVEKVTPDMRRAAKVVNFGILYGLGPQRLARETNLSFEEAKQFIEAYFAGYPGVRKWIDETKKHAYSHGFSETLYGRRRYIPELGSPEGFLRSAGERMAINMPTQGTAADMMKLAMIDVHTELTKKKLTSRMILQVHDELVVEAPKTEVKSVIQILTNCMCNVSKLTVPIVVDVKIGKTWKNMERID